MALYAYKAVDASGNVVNDTLSASSEKDVISRLHGMKCIPIRVFPVEEKNTGNWRSMPRGLSFGFIFSRIRNKDVMLFTQDLSVLLESGLPVDRSLAILKDATENTRFCKVVEDVLETIEGGSDLSAALARHPDAFSDFYVSMVRAGEAGGVLEAVLSRLAEFLESSQQLRDYIKSALIYPVFLFAVGGISIVILMIFVIPRFAVIFNDMGEAVPLSTSILLTLSTLLRSYWWALTGMLGLFFFLLNRYIQTERGRYRLDKIKMSFPFLGNLVAKIEVGRMSRTLGTLINSGVPVLEALLLVKDISVNGFYRKALVDVYDHVKEGGDLSKPLSDTGIFPSLATQMIRVGEETGRMPEMLMKVADNYERIVKHSVQRAVSLLEPIMILLMGGVIGSIVVSMLMAIFSMNDLPF